MGAVNDRVHEAKSLVGVTIAGKWCVERLIGVGGMAAVYEARHRNGRRAAVKVLDLRAGASALQRARFRREGYVANRVGHHGVVEVYDDDIDERGHAFLVMELLSGRTLAEHAAAQGGRLPAEEALSLASDLLDVLEAAHSQQILHRDIKPENLFLTLDGCLKVLDFGIARFTETELDWSGTADGTVLGTPAFSPPEQARGRLDHIDARSDLWAVGATLFTLLTGRYVHEAETPNEQLGKAMTAAAPSLGSVLPDLPQALIHVVDRALAYERDERWPTARAMREAIDWVRSSWPELQSTPARMHPEWVDRASTIEPTTVDAEKPLPAVDGSSHGRRRRATFSLAAAVLTIVAVVFGSSRPRATEGAHAHAAAPHEPSTNAAVSTSTSSGAQPPDPDAFEPPRVPVAMPIVEKPRPIREIRAATTRRGPMLPKVPQNASSANGPDELAGAELPRAVFERRH